jgi:hypothetical protein
MRMNRKGMAAVMDAMLFIAVLGLAASAIFVHISDDPDEPLAGRIHRDIFATELRVSDVFDADDSRVVPIDIIIAAHLSSGEGDVEEYLRSLLRAMVPIPHGFELRCEFRGSVMTISEGGGTPSSGYSSERPAAGGILKTTLTIF